VNREVPARFRERLWVKSLGPTLPLEMFAADTLHISLLAIRAIHRSGNRCSLQKNSGLTTTFWSTGESIVGLTFRGTLLR
jgi:hypothetical protein